MLWRQVDKRRESAARKVTAKRVFLVLFVLVIVVAVLLVRGRPPRAIASMEAPVSVPATSPLPVKPRAESPPPIAGNVRTVEICGYGRVPIDQSDGDAVSKRVTALTQGAETRWLSALQNSGDLRARVAGLLLAGPMSGSASLKGSPNPLAEQARDDAVQLAAGGEDPAVYALALSMCNSTLGSEAAACQSLSPQRWAQLDPDNAAPWLMIASKAQLSGDGAAEAQAFSHAAKAHKMDSYNFSALTFAEPELPPDVTPLERSYLAEEVIGVEAATWNPQYSVATRHCSTDAMHDNTVRQQCDSMAQLLVNQGTNLLDLGIGKTIGAHVGWSKERVDKVVQEQHALMWAILAQEPHEETERWSCDNVNRQSAYFAKLVQLGELGAARDALEHSGESVESMAQNYDRYMDGVRGKLEQQNSATPDQ
jgi:hypothetical protein